MLKKKARKGILAWATADRPREKLEIMGRRQLTDAELLSILIAKGYQEFTAVDLSKELLGRYENDLRELAKISVAELCRIKGIGRAKAVSIVAALELGRRRKELTEKTLSKITSSKDIYQALHANFIDLEHEEFWILILNRSHFVISKQCVSRGGQAGTVVDPKMIFKIALERNACSIVLAHNHPSGNLTPSLADINITKKIVQAGVMLEIGVIDHLIFTNEGFLSLADQSLM